jgi:hypothetical protein
VGPRLSSGGKSKAPNDNDDDNNNEHDQDRGAAASAGEKGRAEERPFVSVSRVCVRASWRNERITKERRNGTQNQIVAFFFVFVLFWFWALLFVLGSFLSFRFGLFTLLFA